MDHLIPRGRTTGALVITGTAVYRRSGSPAVVCGQPYGVPLVTDEQPWRREFAAREDWQPLDCGWLAGKPVSLLCLENHGGPPRNTRPTPGEMAEELARVVELAVDPNPADGGCRTMHDPPDIPPAAFASVAPGRDLRLQPAGHERFRVRCRAGEARCVLYLYPG